MQISKLLMAKGGYMDGEGGRNANNGRQGMQGLTVKSLRHHIALQPLFIIMTCGVTMVAAFCIRSAAKNVDVNWRKHKDPVIVHEVYRNKQFKMLNPGGHDYSADNKDLPNYKD